MKLSNKHFNHAVLAAISLFLAMPVVTFSQSILEEITVTARKREESLMEVPVTIAAFSGDKMQEYNLVKLEDMAQFIPASFRACPA